jgi:thiamine-monophosphate kinase
MALKLKAQREKLAKKSFQDSRMSYAHSMRKTRAKTSPRKSGGPPWAAVSGELALIRQIRDRVAGQPGLVRLGIGDDCALLRVRAGEEIAVTTDLSLDGRHFRLDWHPADSVGHRTLARGLSDLAAMGARPVGAFLSLGLPRELAKTGSGTGREAWLQGFFDGLLALAAEHGAVLAGGDLAESPVAVADVVLVGAIPRGRALLRSGARAGDLLYVTGALGGAAAGLARLATWAATAKPGARGRRHGITADFAAELAAHLYPQPRIQQGLWLQRRGVATAAIDVSDGLSTDLAHLCDESGVAAEVDADLLPVHAGGKAHSECNCRSCRDADWAHGASARRTAADNTDQRKRETAPHAAGVGAFLLKPRFAI